MNLRYLMVAAATIAFMTGAGCSQSKEVGKSGKQLFRGEVGAVVQQSPAQVAQAVETAIADLKLIRITATTRPSREQVETIVIARTAADSKVSVAYRATQKDSTTSTRVIVTTGMMGNSALRDQVWDAVRIRLGVLSVAANANANAGGNSSAGASVSAGGNANSQYGPPAPPVTPSPVLPTASAQ
ncbi:MAG: hypothetical protein QOE14_259 [Humisphaera sp.]|nr:hypothetical protein [Humisphaera sp.]